MGAYSDSISFDSQSRLDLFGRPRLWSLLLGLTFTSLGLLCLWIANSKPSWASGFSGELNFIGLSSVAAGVFITSLSIANELINLDCSTITREGIFLTWSSAPNFFSHKEVKSRMHYWGDLVSIIWIDDEGYPSVRQQLKVKFKEKIFSLNDELVIKISDKRDFERCEILASFLPKDVALPRWFEYAKNTGDRRSLESDGTPPHP